MVISESKIREYQRRLILSRMRLLNKNGFYGLLLMHAGFALEEDVETAAADGKKIFFAPSFMDELTDSELDFILMHEVLHMALKHCFRGENLDNQIFNVACDIVVNSNILLSNDMDYNSITLAKYGESMHCTPNGDEGYNYTAEQVYAMLQKNSNSAKCHKKDMKGIVGNSGSSGGKNCGGYGQEQIKGKQGGGNCASSVQDQNNEEQSSNSGGENCDGYGQKQIKGKQSAGNKTKGKIGQNGTIDSHEKWGSVDDDIKYDWEAWAQSAAQAMQARKACGGVPLAIERMLNEIRNPQIDWRTILQDFVQEEVCDYSFTPPDRRYEGDFFLPDFNDKSDSVRDILFMIDTSGSMSNEMVSTVYYEVKNAIDQYNGRLAGWLGFFDAVVVPPKPFENEQEFSVITAIGGGGTRFDIIFDYVFSQMADSLPSCIIILTDGYAPIPKQDISRDIPVLWVLVDSDVKPSWGRIANINS